MKENLSEGEVLKSENVWAVLVVDDEEAVRRLLSAIFTAPEYQVLAVNDGETALQLAEENRFHIAFIDLMLPGIKGTEVCKAIHELQPGIKTVLMSGYFDEQMGFLLEAAADVLMGKPFSPKSALETAQHLLGSVAQ